MWGVTRCPSPCIYPLSQYALSLLSWKAGSVLALSLHCPVPCTRRLLQCQNHVNKAAVKGMYYLSHVIPVTSLPYRCLTLLLNTNCHSTAEYHTRELKAQKTAAFTTKQRQSHWSTAHHIKSGRSACCECKHPSHGCLFYCHSTRNICMVLPNFK